MKTKIKPIHNSQEVLKHWNRDDIESMYDKNILNLEIKLIKDRITKKSKILDAGCGEGECTLEYSKILGVKIHAVDFSEARLKKAAKRLSNRSNVTLKKVDFLGTYFLDKDYDTIISQRFLINLTGWKSQQKVLLDFKSMLKQGGELVMLEGSIEGVETLNKLRKAFGLNPIDIKWHNLFFNDRTLMNFMKRNNFISVKEDGLGEYFMLTRGLKPYFEKELNWNAKFNKTASSPEIKKILNLGPVCSRLKLWVFKKA